MASIPTELVEKSAGTGSFARLGYDCTLSWCRSTAFSTSSDDMTGAGLATDFDYLDDVELDEPAAV